jgi:hypothetical protein
MTEQFIIRSNKQLDELVGHIKQKRLPFKGVLQDIFPHRSLDANAYLWGVLYKHISEYTGHDVLEIHDFYKNLFNLEYDATHGGTFMLRVVGTSEFDSRAMQEFSMKVWADAGHRFGLYLPLPEECLLPAI